MPALPSTCLFSSLFLLENRSLASRDRFLGRGSEFDELAERVQLASAEFVEEAVDDVSALLNVLQVMRVAG